MIVDSGHYWLRVELRKREETYSLCEQGAIMPATRDEVLKTALDLSVADRLLLATELMDTLPDDLPGWSMEDPDFLDELDRRVADGSPGIPWPQVQAELEARLKP